MYNAVNEPCSFLKLCITVTMMYEYTTTQWCKSTKYYTICTTHSMCCTNTTDMYTLEFIYEVNRVKMYPTQKTALNSCCIFGSLSQGGKVGESKLHTKIRTGLEIDKLVSKASRGLKGSPLEYPLN